MPITTVQSRSIVMLVPVTSVVLDFLGDIGQDDLVVVGAICDGGSVTSADVTDSAGHVWETHPDVPVPFPINDLCLKWNRRTMAGPCTVTFTIDAVSYPCLAIAEYAGHERDQAPKFSSALTPDPTYFNKLATCPPLTTERDHGLVFAVLTTAEGSINTTPAGFTRLVGYEVDFFPKGNIDHYPDAPSMQHAMVWEWPLYADSAWDCFALAFEERVAEATPGQSSRGSFDLVQGESFPGL